MSYNKLEILIGGGGFIGTNYQNISQDKKMIIIDKQFKHKFNNENFTYLKTDLLLNEKSNVLNTIKNSILKNNFNNITIQAYAANLGVKTVIEDDMYSYNEIRLQNNQFEIISSILDLLKENFENYQLNVVYYSTSEVYGNANYMHENEYLKIESGEKFYKRRRYASTKLLMEYLEFYNKNKSEN